jgi:hypothetical protein
MAYQDISGAEPREEVIAALTHHLGQTEVPLAGASSSRFEFRFNTIKLATLLVTNRRLLVAKDKIFGTPKPTVAVDLTEIASTGFGPLYGVGPTWEVHFHTTQNEPAIMYFHDPGSAEAFKNALHNAAMGTIQSSDTDQSLHGLEQTPQEVTARFERLHAFIDDLRPMADQGSLGRPFGEGWGLEEATQAAFRHFESPDDARENGLTIAVDIMGNTKDEQIADEMLAIMGATPNAMQQYQLSSDAREAIHNLSGAAEGFLAQFEGPGNMWDLWKKRDDVAVEFLCWHTVARLRMATTGRMPPVERP